MTVRLPAWLQSGSYSAETDRSVATGLLVPVSALAARGGVRHYNGNDLKVSATSPATMQININSGMAWVPGLLANVQGTYAVINDALVTLAIPAADPGNPRIDLIILEVLDQVYTGTIDLAQLRVVTGTPASSPIAPSVAGNYLVLAKVTVTANVSSISSSAITDLRNFAAALGSPTPVVSASARLALTSTPAGMSVYEIDTTRVYQWTGSQWNYQWGGVAPTVSVTPAGGWYNWSAVRGGNLAQLRGSKVNSFVNISGVLGNTDPFSSRALMFSLPSGWFPEKDTVKDCRISTSNTPLRIDIAATGQVYINAYQSVPVPANIAWFVDFQINTRNNSVG